MTALLQLHDLRVHFPVRGAKAGTVVKAVDGVSLHVMPGETLALVGESGCGKSTTDYAALGLEQPTGGQVFFEGEDTTHARGAARRALSGRMQIVFQDPSAALNPRMTIGDSIAEPMAIHGIPRPARRARVAELMELAGLPAAQATRYPNELSGGQRQRVVIARALALSPKLLICDEPVSALDVSIRSQILNLLLRLQAELGLAYLFISHDLSVVRHIADRVAVMYLGTIVEQGPAEAVFATPLHPYTEALLSAIPVPDPRVQRQRRRIALPGELPSPLSAPQGCPFVGRCALRVERCSLERPALSRVGEQEVACFVRGG
jgi:oligopeptide transport system ATP-binding protein